MLLVFYVLVIQQVLQGLYSLWQGIAWLGYVRRRLSTHAGFYTPQVALICPCKGSEPGLETSLMSLTKFEYSNYEIFFTLATSLDPAIKAIERVKATSPRKIHIVIVGPPEDSGEKVSNLRKAVEKLDESFNVIVFVDSDVTLSRAWLTKLISPLGDARVGAATTYRWLIPTRWPNKQDFASALGSAWNASVATMLGDHGHNFCWGGGTAIRRGTFNDINALEFWQGAVSDDLALTNALENQNKQILFVPECMAPTLYGATFAELLEFTNRQIILTRVYSPRMWVAGFLSHASYVITSIVALFVVFSEMIIGRSVGTTSASRAGDSAARDDEGRAANDRHRRIASRMEDENARLELGVDGAGADCAVLVFLEFLRFARLKNNSLARNSLPPRLRQSDANPQTLAANSDGRHQTSGHFLAAITEKKIGAAGRAEIRCENIFRPHPGALENRAIRGVKIEQRARRRRRMARRHHRQPRKRIRILVRRECIDGAIEPIARGGKLTREFLSRLRDRLRNSNGRCRDRARR